MKYLHILRYTMCLTVLPWFINLKLLKSAILHFYGVHQFWGSWWHQPPACPINNVLDIQKIRGAVSKFALTPSSFVIKVTVLLFQSCQLVFFSRCNNLSAKFCHLSSYAIRFCHQAAHSSILILNDVFYLPERNNNLPERLIFTALCNAIISFYKKQNFPAVFFGPVMQLSM